MQADVDTILEKQGTEPESVDLELAKDTVFVSLFTTPLEPHPDPPGHAKRHHSRHTYEEKDSRATKKVSKELEPVSKVSLIEEEAA